MESVNCINLETGKTKKLALTIASNQVLMKKIGWAVADPDYDSLGNKIDSNFLPELPKETNPQPFQSNPEPDEKDIFAKPEPPKKPKSRKK